MNTERMLRLADAIESNPERFSIEDWFYASEYDAAGTKLRESEARREPVCGTTACVAGWTVLMFGDGRGSRGSRYLPSQARELLGLTREQGSQLFYGRDARGRDEEDVSAAATVAKIRRMVAEYTEYSQIPV